MDPTNPIEITVTFPNSTQITYGSVTNWQKTDTKFSFSGVKSGETSAKKTTYWVDKIAGYTWVEAS